jgi:hypothetical protein
MKHFIITTAILLCAFKGYSQKTVSDTVNRKIDGKKEGYWSSYTKQGKLKWEGYYLHGEKTGLWKFYDEHGNRDEGKMINGERTGEWYVIGSDGTRLDMTRWDGKGHCIGGATLSW